MLRGTLPKKPGEGLGNKQRYIALGVFANSDGIRVALAKAQRLESDLNMDRFSWSDWEKSEVDSGGKTAKEWGREFGKIKAGTIQESSYRTDYKERLATLPEKPLTEQNLIDHILNRSKPNTRKRKYDCMVFSQLARFADIEVDFKAIQGKYQPRKLSIGDIPLDDEIEAIWASIKNPGWRWVYGVIATYGLRPHEVFHIIDVKNINSPNGKISIPEETKTGYRDVWPLPNKWREKFRLADVVFPAIRVEGRDNQQLGERVGQNLRHQKSRKIPHTPYALRHAWAIRSAVMGVPDSIAAKWIGHSVSVHAETYHAAINQLQHEAIWEKANQTYKPINSSDLSRTSPIEE